MQRRRGDNRTPRRPCIRLPCSSAMSQIMHADSQSVIVSVADHMWVEGGRRADTRWADN